MSLPYLQQDLKSPFMDNPFEIKSSSLAEVKVLDPLGLDAVFLELPERNKREDIAWIIEQLNSHLHESLPDEASKMDIRIALAIVRDLGMLAASMRRHGVQVRDVSPLAEEALLALGNRTGMVPRDTVFHYGPGNPRGERERTFTGDDNERMLIEATRVAFPHLEEAVEQCSALLQIPFDNPAFAEKALACSLALDGLITAIILTRKSVDPLFFAAELRPYFEAVRLGDRDLSGAAAAPLSVGIIDHILWSSDCKSPEYRSFQDHNLLYNIPSMKKLYSDLLGKPSLVTLLSALKDTRQEAHRNSAIALDKILNQILNFRGKHIAVAKSAYSLQSRLKVIWMKGASKVFGIGSAGYGLDTLDMILDLTKDAKTRLITAFPETEQ
jgi:hypothetical protein